MAKNHYTFLIVPRKKSSVKKISASSAVVKGVALALVLVLASTGYFFYDYLSTKKHEFELSYLKKLTQNQKEQINTLATKVNDFERKMEDLKQLDQKIRSMTNLEKKQSKAPSQMLGVGGFESGKQNAPVEHVTKNIDRLIQDASEQERSFDEVLNYLKKRESILAATPSVWPVRGWVTSEFGRRTSPYGERVEFHQGMDIACRIGMEVRAPADGIVSEVVNRSDMGNYVIIDHMKGISTGYAHLLKAVVADGKRVKRGEIIGYVGNSGRSTGSHLHYSVSLNGIPVNPRKYLN
jgi:murein DD-endopeptidase MepM/ murein hydrolase activator NlpD